MAALRIREPVHRLDALDDKQLTLSFQRGDEEAYRAIYENYRRSVYGVCWRMLGHREDAQEATQETFLRVYQALGRFNGRYQLGPWIMRIATNVCLDHLRGRSRKPVGATSIDELDYEPHTNDDDPEALYLRSVEGRRIRSVLATLPAAHRAALVLRDFQGLSYKDIALTLDISETQVKALIHRARKGFRSSWSSTPLAALWPSTMLHRLAERSRGRELLRSGAADVATSSGHVAEAAASIAPSVASHGMFQHLAQVLTERFAPAVTAAVIGTGAMAGAPAIIGSAQGTAMAHAIVSSVSAGAAAVAAAADELEAIAGSGDAVQAAEPDGDEEGEPPGASAALEESVGAATEEKVAEAPETVSLVESVGTPEGAPVDVGPPPDVPGVPDEDVAEPDGEIATDPVPDDPVSDDPVPDDPVSDDTVPDDTVSDDPVPDDTVPDDTVPDADDDDADDDDADDDDADDDDGADEGSGSEEDEDAAQGAADTTNGATDAIGSLVG